MSAQKETLSRIQGFLFRLRRGLALFVEPRMKVRRGEKWLTFANRAGGVPGAAQTVLR